MDLKILFIFSIFLFLLSINAKTVLASGTKSCLIKSDTYNCSFCPNADLIAICTPHNITCAETQCAEWINNDPNTCNWDIGVNFCNYTFTLEDIQMMSFCGQVANLDEYYCYYRPPLNTIDFSQLNYIRQYGNILHNHNICTDNETLGHNVTYTITIDQNQSIVNVWVNEPCEFGCDNITQTCNPSPSNVNFNFFIIFGSMAFIILLLVVIKQKR